MVPAPWGGASADACQGTVAPGASVTAVVRAVAVVVDEPTSDGPVTTMSTGKGSTTTAAELVFSSVP
jgi:hypothetical protein